MSIYEYLRIFVWKSMKNNFLKFRACLHCSWLPRSLVIIIFMLVGIHFNFFLFKNDNVYSMIELGETRIFKISMYRWVTCIFMTLHDQNGHWNSILMNIMVLKNYDAPDFWWFSVIFIIFIIVFMNERSTE